jgi:hypothetical protein
MSSIVDREYTGSSPVGHPYNDFAGIAEWYSSCLVSSRREFDPLYRHHFIAPVAKSG